LDNASLNIIVIRAKTCRVSMSEVIKELQPRLVELVRASLIHRNDRADAVQEVLIQVLRCVASYDPEKGDFANYALSSAKLLLYREHKKNGRVHNHETHQEVPEAASPDSKEPPVETAPVIPAKYREVVGDYYGIDRPRSYSINQIAARRGMSNTAVRNALKESISLMKGKSIV